MIKQFGNDTLANVALHDYLMNKKTIKAIKKVHKYKISEYCRGGFFTCVPNPKPLDSSHRKQLKADTLEQLYLKLINYYGLQYNDNLTLNQLFDQWESYRRNIMTDENTILRDHQRYVKYFANTAFFKRDLSSIRRSDWKEFCCQVISGLTRSVECSDADFKLTRKEWGNTKSILNGMLNLALDNEYITTNPLLGMTFEKHLFKESKHKDSDTQVFNEIEQQNLVCWCKEKFEETNDVAYLFPPLNLLLGARIGEVAALTWSDIIDDRYILIRKEEKRLQTNYYRSIEQHTKTFHNRKVPINSEAIEILEMIKGVGNAGEWIFSRNGKRLTTRQLNYILEKYAKANNLTVKASHALRRTFGSNLYKNGATSKQCSNILGNGVDVFEKYYLYDTSTDDELKSIVDKVSLKPMLRVV